jgi:hypothetical protein
MSEEGGQCPAVREGDGMTYDEIMDDYYDEYQDEHVTRRRFMLVERNVGGDTPQHWLTCYDSAQEALDYHDSQEAANDWVVEGLYDLDSGERLETETRTVIVTGLPTFAI